MQMHTAAGPPSGARPDMRRATMDSHVSTSRRPFLRERLDGLARETAATGSWSTPVATGVVARHGPVDTVAPLARSVDQRGRQRDRRHQNGATNPATPPGPGLTDATSGCSSRRSACPAARRDPSDPRRGRPGRRGERVRQPVGDGPPVPAARGHRLGRPDGTDARGVHDARLPRPGDRADRLGSAGRRRPLPPPGAAHEGRDDARRPGRRPGLLRDRRRLVQREARRTGHPLAGAARAIRTARGDAPARPARCSPATGRRSRAAHSRLAEPILSPAAAATPPSADHGRRWRRAEDARARRPYADACNILVPDPGESRQKIEVLRRHCEAIGRDPAEIETTSLVEVDLRRAETRGRRSSAAP